MVIDFICECIFLKYFQHIAFGGTWHHGIHIITLANPTPINTIFQSFFQYQIQPNPSMSAVAFHKRMSNVHFYLFFCNFLKSSFWHLL